MTRLTHLTVSALPMVVTLHELEDKEGISELLNRVISTIKDCVNDVQIPTTHKLTQILSGICWYE